MHILNNEHVLYYNYERSGLHDFQQNAYVMFFRHTLALCESPRTMRNNLTVTSTIACRSISIISCLIHSTVMLAEVCWARGVGRLRAILLQQLQVKAAKHKAVPHQAPTNCPLPPYKTLQASLTLTCLCNTVKYWYCKYGDPSCHNCL